MMLTRRKLLVVAASSAGASLCACALGCSPGAVGPDAGAEGGNPYEVPVEGAAYIDREARLAISRVEGRGYAHSIVCTHESCLVDIGRQQACFDCPCHGARYGLDGSKLAEPATRALDRYALALRDDGRLEVDFEIRLREGEEGYDDTYVDL